jgi:hypothetical protein
MGGDALQSAAAHTAMAAMAYLSNIKSGFLIGKPTEMAGGSVGLGSRLEAGPARRADIYVTKKGSDELRDGRHANSRCVVQHLARYDGALSDHTQPGIVKRKASAAARAAWRLPTLQRRAASGGVSDSAYAELLRLSERSWPATLMW